MLVREYFVYLPFFDILRLELQIESGISYHQSACRSCEKQSSCLLVLDSLADLNCFLDQLEKLPICSDSHGSIDTSDKLELSNLDQLLN